MHDFSAVTLSFASRNVSVRFNERLSHINRERVVEGDFGCVEDLGLGSPQAQAANDGAQVRIKVKAAFERIDVGPETKHFGEKAFLESKHGVVAGKHAGNLEHLFL